MKVSREQALENRKRVVDAASTLLRERGLDGIGVADLMKAAGLTHGGFYGQFASKDDLVAEACALSFDRSAARWKDLAAQRPEAGVHAIADGYLTRRHVAQPGGGCAAAALAGDAARQGPQVKEVMEQGVNALVDVLAETLPGRTRQARRRRALASFSAMVGAIVLARAVADEGLADEILEAVRERL